MNNAQTSLQTQKVAVGGMTCSNCEILVERRFKEILGVEAVRLDRRRGLVEIDHRGDLDVASLQRAVEKDGYHVSSWAQSAVAQESALQRYAVIGGFFLVIAGAVFALQRFGGTPHGFALSETMSLGLVFLIGLVASVSSCMAVTGGLVVAAAAAYDQGSPGLSNFERLKPHFYFNAGRIISYTLLGGAIGALGSALTLSAATNGLLTIAASAIMILLGFQMLGVVPKLGRFVPTSLARGIHDLVSRRVAGGAFTFGALTFFLPCGFTQALQLYVLGKGSFTTGALTMLVFALGTLPALVSLSAVSSLARGIFQRYFLRLAGVAVVVLGALNIQYGLNLRDLGSSVTPLLETGAQSIAPVSATQMEGKQVVAMRVVDFTYMPAVFQVKQGIPVEWRIDASEAVGCGLMILAPRLRIRQLLSSISTTVIAFTPREIGEFQFNCGMGMMSPWEARFIVVPSG